AVYRLRLADETEIDVALDVRVRVLDGPRHALGEDHVAILAGEADRLAPLGIDRHDDFLVDRAGEHHLDHLDGRLVGDAEPGAELRLDAETAEHLADLWAAA